MNRRAFLGRLSAGVVGTCVAANLPTAWLPASVRSAAAREFLRREYNAWVGRYGVHPSLIVADTRLYEAYESELVAIERFSVGRGPRRGALIFKGTPIVPSRIRTDAWSVTMVAGETA